MQFLGVDVSHVSTLELIPVVGLALDSSLDSSFGSNLAPAAGWFSGRHGKRLCHCPETAGGGRHQVWVSQVQIQTVKANTNLLKYIKNR